MTARHRIRPYRDTDFDALNRIRAAAFAPIFASFRSLLGPRIAAVALAGLEREQEDLLREICDAASPYEVVVLDLDDGISGFCSWSPRRDATVGEIGLNAIRPDRQGQGLGTALYRAVLARMRERGMRVATVGTGGDASHAAARRAYEKAGLTVGIASAWLYRAL